MQEKRPLTKGAKLAMEEKAEKGDRVVQICGNARSNKIQLETMARRSRAHVKSAADAGLPPT